MRKSIICGALAAITLASCSTPSEQTAVYSVIPAPQEITLGEGEGFHMTDKTVIVAGENDSLQRYAAFLSDYIADLTGTRLKIVGENPGRDAILLERNLRSENPEAYTLTVNDSLVTIDGATAAGTFYGIQTLRKSIPAKERSTVLFPAVTINDYPRFAYRGAHFDVSRHFFPTDSVKSFIDMLALHNINRLHWHLTDDQGWRVEIKKYPKLTEISSKRGGTVIGHNSGVYDSIPYEGFYTQDEIRDIVKYASDRNIVIVPEIDLPGHMVAALAAYPELGCTGGPYDVWQQWGVSEDLLCAGNDSTLEFIDGVLEEIVELFPSEYVHLGGDECPKVRWEECEKCQARIAALGLKNDSHSTKEQKLQSFVMEHATNFLASKGRRMIGWDEIMEGGMDPNAVVMSWRGESGGIQGAKLGHDVIMTPNTYLYFDYYQTLDRTDEPDAIGGYLPIEKVYSYEPYPESLTPDEQKHIIGVQANLWTEYMPTYAQVQYMELPRMAALSEVQWTMPEKKDYNNFAHRLPQLVNHYDALGYNYARHIYNVTPSLTLDPAKHAIVATFSTVDDAPVHYTLDGTEPTEESPLYESPIEITESGKIMAAAFRPSGRSKIYVDSVSFNKATAREVTLLTPPSNQYRAKLGATLSDGKFGAESFNTGDWVAWVGNNMEILVDLGEEETVSTVSFNANVNTDNWIFDFRSIDVLLSEDGKNFTSVAREDNPTLESPLNEIVNHTLTFPARKARYVKIVGVPENKIPSWHIGKGNTAFVFVDEIVID
ncbi:MAG: glycoside hydrolase family 20 protein [Clostridium sp.]|nr:glycoside hydrolase family 20 protein [Clostridium sp.]